jgi:hypothetical protein
MPLAARATEAAPSPNAVQLSDPDLTEGQPAGHCVRCCWIGMPIGQRIGLSTDQLWDLYYTLLLKDLGCSSNAARICELSLHDDLQFKRDFKSVAVPRRDPEGRWAACRIRISAMASSRWGRRRTAARRPDVHRRRVEGHFDAARPRPA